MRKKNRELLDNTIKFHNSIKIFPIFEDKKDVNKELKQELIKLKKLTAELIGILS